MTEPQPDTDESKPIDPQPTRVLEMRMLHAKGEIGGEADEPSKPLTKAAPYTGVAPSGIAGCCNKPLDDHEGLIETRDSRLWICPTEETNGS